VASPNRRGGYQLDARKDTLQEQALGRTAIEELPPMQPGDVQQTWADVSKSARVLGYAPQTRLEEGIDRFVTWFRGAYARER